MKETHATIIIHGITHRDACLEGDSTPDAPIEYERRLPQFIETLTSAAEKQGLIIEFSPNTQYGHGSYQVFADDFADIEFAHDFMMWLAQEFWA